MPFNLDTEICKLNRNISYFMKNMELISVAQVKFVAETKLLLFSWRR